MIMPMTEFIPAQAAAPASVAHCAIRLRASHSHLLRQLRSAQPADGMSVARLSVLGQLHRHGALTPSELARRERVKLQSLTRLLADLEADGWLLRKPHSTDARQSVLSLTKLGARMLAADVQRRESSLVGAISQSLSKDERVLLLAACQLIDRVADTIEIERMGKAVAAMTRGTAP
jgi:DNA-binding MarR family transcriptional regulator